MSSRRILRHILTLTALAAATLIALAAPVMAKSYTDVPQSHWAYASISSVTNRTVAGHRLLDDYKTLFRPERAITRELLARSVVLASGHYGEGIAPVDIADVPKGYRYYSVIQMAVHLGYMGVGKDGTFRPTEKVSAAAARDRDGPLAQGAGTPPTTGRCSAPSRRRAGGRTKGGRRARPPTSPPSSPRAS